MRGFKTSKGSTYEVHEDGTTTRNKAFRPEHGKLSQGPQRRSMSTHYLTMEDVFRFYAEGSDHVTLHKDPALGLHPLEYFNDMTIVHIGNAIVEIWE